MININKTNFININTPNKIYTRPSFNGKDVFISSVKGQEMPMDKDILALFNKKIKGLPIGMDGIMVILGRYLSDNVPCKEFSEIYLNRTPFLFKRIEFGTDKEEYSQNYKPEIDLIKAVNPLCNDYLNNKISQKDLDNSLEKLVENYVKTEHKRERLFIK